MLHLVGALKNTEKKKRRRKRIKRENERDGYYYCQKIKWCPGDTWEIVADGGIQVAYGV